MSISRRISGIIAGITAFCCLSAANAQQFQTPLPEIVSAWKLNGEDVVVVFLYDGGYYLIDGNPDNPGMERGTFTWDEETQAFSVKTIVDTTGDGGLSHPAGAASVSITGNTLNYTVVGEGTFTFTRVLNNSLVGSWVIPGEKLSLTFLSDNTYYFTQEANDVPFGYSGMEKGTYTWNSTTKAFSATASIDMNGDIGLNGTPPGFTANVTGNTLVFTEGSETFTLTRVTTNTTPVKLPDFGTSRFTNYNQTSNNAPALRPFNEANESYPYSADAFVNGVNATAPTLKIGAGTPLHIEPDDGGFSIEGGFSTLNELNAFLPASTAVEFKDGASTANLTTGASLTFPTTPKIIVRDGDAWIGGVYRFGENEVLQWTLPTGFNASQNLTIIEVKDPSENREIVFAPLQGEVTHFDLGGKLESGKEYEIKIEFYRLDHSTTAGNGVFSGKTGYILSASSTRLTAKALPDTAGSPFITEHPESQDGVPGSPLLLTVGVTEGTFPTATFRWFKNNQEIIGQTSNSLFIPSFDLDEHSGRYQVFVENDIGLTESMLANVGNVGTEDQAVRILVAWKQKISEQRSATLLTPVGAAFNAGVEGSGITATFPSANITLTKPDSSTIPFELDGNRWRSGDDFATFAALQTGFPDGIYQFNIGSIRFRSTSAAQITRTSRSLPHQ